MLSEEQINQDKYKAIQINRKVNMVLQNLSHADSMVYKGYPDAQCATLYIECGNALMKIREETKDDPNFQEAVVEKIRETARRAQKCKENIARKEELNNPVPASQVEENKEPLQPIGQMISYTGNQNANGVMQQNGMMQRPESAPSGQRSRPANQPQRANVVPQARPETAQVVNAERSTTQTVLSNIGQGFSLFGKMVYSGGKAAAKVITDNNASQNAQTSTTQTTTAKKNIPTFA